MQRLAPAALVIALLPVVGFAITEGGPENTIATPEMLAAYEAQVRAETGTRR